jgi:hypothetical protein
VAQSGPQQRLGRCSSEEGGMTALVHGFQRGLEQNEEGDMGALRSGSSFGNGSVGGDGCRDSSSEQ